MTTVVLSRSAQRDVDEILDRLEAEAGSRVAIKYSLLFEREYDLLERLPLGRRARPDLGDNVRSAYIHPFVLIYDYDAETDMVSVLRIVHGRRNITRKLIQR